MTSRLRTPPFRPKKRPRATAKSLFRAKRVFRATEKLFFSIKSKKKGYDSTFLIENITFAKY